MGGSDSERHGSQDDPQRTMLKERLKGLRCRIKGMRRDLLCAVRETEFNGEGLSFSAKSFKTGRGRYR